jgi:serine/threonine protein phosphatase PrpC
MQGWRNGMEDTHICEMDIADGVHFFGVYDGHGGKSLSGLTIYRS